MLVDRGDRKITPIAAQPYFASASIVKKKIVMNFQTSSRNNP